MEKDITKDGIKTVLISYRPGNKEAFRWEKKIKSWLKSKHGSVKIVAQNPQAVIALGGDGTILGAIRRYQEQNPIFIGLNLGNVGFLASSRQPANFLNDLDHFFKGRAKIIERMMISAQVKRKNRTIFRCNALNEIVVKNLLGMVEIEAKIDDHPVQYIRGTGMMVATATGSTAYNLSAHGPIVMPEIKCLILTELLDHNIPTPSIIVSHNKKIFLEIINYRARGILSLSKTGKKVDVTLVADGDSVFPLAEGDIVAVESHAHTVRFADLEDHYFFKSLKEKFSYK